jgi:hypothetical protein
MRQRWIIVVAVAVVAVVIGVLFGYVAGLAVVFAFVTVGVFYAWWGGGGALGEAERTGRRWGAERERHKNGDGAAR